MPRVLRGAEPSWREMGLRKTVPDLVREPADIGDRRLRTSIFLVRRLRRISHWVIRRGIAEKLVRPLPWLGGWRALHAQGWIAGVTRRHADHTDFWREAANLYPKNSVFTRNMVHAALRAGRFAEADTGLTALIEGRKTIVGDCRFVIGLTFVDLRRGDVARIRKRVRSILVSFRGTAASRIAAVRLSRVIFAHFPPKARDQSGGERSWRLPFVHMLSCSGVKPEPKKVLLRVAECEAQLERVFPGCLFDTDISAAQCRTFVSLVRARLLRRQPFAFVRAGDGEAACLPYEPRLASHAEADARERELIWWGRSLAPALRARIATAVARAIWDADCIGIPTIARFLRLRSSLSRRA